VSFLGAAPALASDADVNPSSGELSFNAAQGVQNAVVITGAAPSITISDPTDPITPGAGCASVDATTVTCDGVSGIKVSVRDKDDTVTNDSSLGAYLEGLNGNDTLTGSDGGADILDGGNESDVLDGRGGDDTLIGDEADPARVGDDQLIGGAGVDLAHFRSAGALTIDLGIAGPQNSGQGMDTFSGVENVNGTGVGDRLIGDGASNVFVGKGGDDEIRIRDGGSDSANCGTGYDLVVMDRTDTLLDGFACEEVNDGLAPGNTTITGGPTGLTNNPTWTFTSNEPWAGFECVVAATEAEIGALPDTAWSACTSGAPFLAPDGTAVFAVRAIDDQEMRDPQGDSTSFTLDTTAPDTRIDSGPSGGGVTTNPAPEFSFSSNDSDTTGFLCRFDSGNFFVCASPFTPSPLSEGEHTLQVVATDVAGNFDNTPAEVTFRVDTGGPGPGPGDGPPPGSQTTPTPPATQTKIVIGSLVLISGNAAKMTRKGRVSISLTCAGASKCTGRLSITTAEPVGKRKSKLVTLGAKKFTIGGNQKRKVKVKFSKRNIRLAKRLKRFKAKALIREIDNRGNLRLSSRIFTLRAR
jgi:hypothetical protein